jgi:hypothetical protein
MAKNKSYDEKAVLTGYIWNYYQHLMTEFERKVNTVGILLEKAELSRLRHPDSKSPASMLERIDVMSSPGVKEALEGGFTKFREKVVHRILTEDSKQVFINRCPNCNRIVRTPKAKLCTWCGHSWYDVDRVGS